MAGRGVVKKSLSAYLEGSMVNFKFFAWLYTLFEQSAVHNDETNRDLIPRLNKSAYAG
jgi:hypothetical protein